MRELCDSQNAQGALAGSPQEDGPFWALPGFGRESRVSILRQHAWKLLTGEELRGSYTLPTD